MIQNNIALRLLPLLIVVLYSSLCSATDWRIPAAGNAYCTSPDSVRYQRNRDGSIAWRGEEQVISLYFHVDKAAELLLSLDVVPSSEATSEIEVKVSNKRYLLNLKRNGPEKVEIGAYRVDEPGYVRVDLSGRSKTGEMYGAIKGLAVSSETEDLKIEYVRNNDGNMFYWGRRGPSVHLSYELPQDRNIQFAYSELTVPKNLDPIGSYFMANGFREGYFGMQVKSETERWILFSIWSPFQTDDPKSIPEEDRIKLLAKGPEVHVGEFGNEGSGGQSYLKFPWKAGRTYSFLTEVKPDGKGNTIYTSWFCDTASMDWMLIASFQRPKTDTHLRGFHSFLENFSPEHGHLPRLVTYQNVWVRESEGEWHACRRARFSVDQTGAQRHRLDYGGGVDKGRFFLQNCGFNCEPIKPGSRFSLPDEIGRHPQIDFDALPRK